MKNSETSARSRCAAFPRARRLALIAFTALSAASLSGCLGDTVQAAGSSSKGAQPTAWGPAYPNMPDLPPPNIRVDEYSQIKAADAGPAIDPAKGYRTEDLGGGVYMVTEGAYQATLIVSDVGVILCDAPPTIGAGLLKAVQDVSPGGKIVALVYSHAHIDHIGYAGEIVKSNPSMAIIAHAETAQQLVRAGDPARPVPTQTFSTQDVDYPVVVGNQTLQLRYPGRNHTPGNIAIYMPRQKVLMVVDIVFPGWMMWRRFAVAEDIPGYFDTVKKMTTDWDFNTLVAGHVGRVGTKADVAEQLEFITDLQNAAFLGLSTVKPGVTINPKNANNPWAYFRDYLDQVNNACVNALSPKWASRLAAFDVFIYEQCAAMEQSLRVDGPSIKASAGQGS